MPMVSKCLVSIGICFAIVALTVACNKKSAPTAISKDSEELRVTSPNGQFDAVLVRLDAGGAAGGWDYYVYIVAKGKAVFTSEHSILYAGTLRGEKLAWAQAHLLNIQYDVADIHEFRNLWGLSEIQNLGSTGEGDYLVEIRLAPTSQDFSLLNATGEFKRKD